MQDMHYADFAEDDVSFATQHAAETILTLPDQSAALLAAIKEYEASKWKVIGQKVGKPAKVKQLRHPASPFIYTDDLRRASSMQRRISEERSEECASLL